MNVHTHIYMYVRNHTLHRDKRRQNFHGLGTAKFTRCFNACLDSATPETGNFLPHQAFHAEARAYSRRSLSCLQISQSPCPGEIAAMKGDEEDGGWKQGWTETTRRRKGCVVVGETSNTRE